MQQASLFLSEGPTAGVDEAGRGPLAGPVVAAAVILDPAVEIDGLDDSKKLDAATRQALAREIRCKAVACSVAWCDAAEIDALNILAATMLAMRRAVLGLGVVPSTVRVDGNRLPNLEANGRAPVAEAIVGGDGKVASISAASILAKTTRDAFMIAMDELYPVYEFARHKGYGTATHRERLAEHGPCQLHRRSFAPLRLAV